MWFYNFLGIIELNINKNFFVTMVTNCVVKGCRNASDIKKSLSFHGFPFKHSDILKLWISATGRQNWYPSKSSKICGEHFLPSDYQLLHGYTKKRLKIDAVPSVLITVEHLTRTSERHIKTGEIEEPMDVNLKIPDFNSPSISTAGLNTLAVSEDANIYPLTDSPSTSVAKSNIFSLSDDTNSHPVTYLLSPPKEPKTVVHRACQTTETYHSSTILKRKLKTLQQKLKRREIKITNIKEVINEIKKSGHSNAKLEEVLKNYFEGNLIV